MAADTESTFKLPGVGKKIAKHLERIAIYSPHDLLLHLPSRYQNRTRVQTIRELVIEREAVIEATIKSVIKPTRGRTKLLCELKDKTGTLYLRFFHVLSFQADVLKPGKVLRCYSEVRSGPQGLEMVHPEFQVIVPGKPLPMDQYLTPIYPATEGLSQYMLRKLTMNALAWMRNNSLYVDIIPEVLREALKFPRFKEALFFVHRPPHNASIPELMEYKTHAQQYLAFEELLAHRISLLHIKKKFQTQTSVALTEFISLTQKFLTQLPFTLTHAQKRVIEEIKTDLLRSNPMLRLVQGDVGSGKTVVAAIAMLQAVESGYQAAMMAPTELLAEQHYRVFQRWFEPLGLKVVFLSGNIKAKAREQILQTISAGDAQIILGTHALFQEQVHFNKLALVVVDEQHRFGVEQRALFRKKGLQADYYPHQLVMTATPIPRTLAMSFYADLDCSVIDELPPGRTPILTSVLANSRRDEIIERVREACQQGRQAYWVCPLIDESDVLNCEAATAVAEKLQQVLSPALTVGLIHGRMRAEEKDKVMHAFQQGEVDLLVATTVIEVGVDVANASVMVIENAERLGLSQLHQLRGRVGRGAVASYCLLLYQQPLSELSKERLKVMRDTTDGFQIAQRDLELRGPGDVLGTRQTGALTFSVADLMRDSHLLPDVHKAAAMLMKHDHEAMHLLIKRWLGDEEEYGKV